MLSPPSPACVCVLISPSYKDTSQTGLGPTHVTSFYLGFTLKTPSPIQSHSEVLAIRTSPREFWGQRGTQFKPQHQSGPGTAELDRPHTEMATASSGTHLPDQVCLAVSAGMKMLVPVIITINVISITKPLKALDAVLKVVRSKWNSFFIWDKPLSTCCFFSPEQGEPRADGEADQPGCCSGR